MIIFLQVRYLSHRPRWIAIGGKKLCFLLRASCTPSNSSCPHPTIILFHLHFKLPLLIIILFIILSIPDARGLEVWDNSYVDISGCWAASSDHDNIWVSPGSHDALVVVSGGTIFNGGALGGNASRGECNGITVNAGSFALNGVAIRWNKGVGVWTPGTAKNFVINGNQIFSNGRGALLGGEAHVVTGNVFSDNLEDSDLGKGDNVVVANNIFNPR